MSEPSGADYDASPLAARFRSVRDVRGRIARELELLDRYRLFTGRRSLALRSRAVEVWTRKKRKLDHYPKELPKPKKTDDTIVYCITDLVPKQNLYLVLFMRDYHSKYGKLPSIKEWRMCCGLNSDGRVQRLRSELTKAGVLLRSGSTSNTRFTIKPEYLPLGNPEFWKTPTSIDIPKVP